MKRFKRLTAAVMILFSATGASAQHYNAWLRTTLSYPTGSSIKTEAEFQHRRQNGFENSNPMDKDLMYSFRSWVHYQYRDNLRFSLSPYACFSGYRIIQDEKDERASPTREIRFTAAAEVQQPGKRNMQFFNRTGLEYRIFQGTVHDILRGRSRFGLRYGIKPGLKAVVYEEGLFNLSGATSGHFFDHNRVAAGFEFAVSPPLKLDTGYMYILRQPLNSNFVLQEHNFYFNLTFLIPSHKLSATTRI